MDLNFFYNQYLELFLLTLLRSYAFVYFFYPTKQLPNTIRTGLALVLTCYTFYMNEPFISTMQKFILLMLSNVAVGFMVGYIISLPFYILQMFGSEVDSLRGETMGAIINNFFVPSQSSFYNFMNMCFLTYFISCNGLILMVKTLVLTYKMVPVFQLEFDGLIKHMIPMFEHLFTWFAILSFPAIMISLLIDMIFAFSAVVVPSLNTFYLGLPLKSMAILFMYMLFLPSILNYMMGYFQTVITFLGV